MKEAIINLLAWERYIPVMTENEQRDIMQGVAPTAAQLAEWSHRLPPRKDWQVIFSQSRSGSDADNKPVSGQNTSFIIRRKLPPPPVPSIRSTMQQQPRKDVPITYDLLGAPLLGNYRSLVGCSR